MHGAWAFDLLLLFFTGGVTVMAFRQIIAEQDHTETPYIDLSPRPLSEVAPPELVSSSSGSNLPPA
jgi:hypothetical protein